MVEGVGDQQIAGRIERQIVRRKKARLRRRPAITAESPFPGPGDHGQMSPAVEFQHTVRADVGDVQIAFGVKSEPVRRDQIYGGQPFVGGILARRSGGREKRG
jgi:hypothetical protein